MQKLPLNNVEKYYQTVAPESLGHLLQLRQMIQKELPLAEESISYGIPTFKLNGKFVIYIAGYKTHVSIHPIPPGDFAFHKAIEPYVAGKGTLRFPLDKPLPLLLIRKVTKLSLKRNLERTNGSQDKV